MPRQRKDRAPETRRDHVARHDQEEAEDGTGMMKRSSDCAFLTREASRVMEVVTDQVNSAQGHSGRGPGKQLHHATTSWLAHPEQTYETHGPQRKALNN